MPLPVLEVSETAMELPSGLNATSYRPLLSGSWKVALSLPVATFHR